MSHPTPPPTDASSALPPTASPDSVEVTADDYLQAFEDVAIELTRQNVRLRAQAAARNRELDTARTQRDQAMRVADTLRAQAPPDRGD